MKSRLKICVIIVGLTFGLSGCAQADLDKLGHNLDSLNQALGTPEYSGEAQANTGASGGAKTGGVAMATQPEESQRKKAQLIIPNDKQTAAAIDVALPTIKKILSIHQCVKDYNSLRQMNIYAVPGVDMAQGAHNGSYPNSVDFMRYHDRNKCVSVSTLDQWTMPALNALQFRAVYFADDSGETLNFTYLFKRADDGSWKLAEFRRAY